MASEFEEPVTDFTGRDAGETAFTGEEEQPTKHEGVGGVLGVFIGLLILLSSAAGIMAVRGQSMDGQAELERFMGASPYAFGLELAESAKLPTGEKILRLEPAEPAATTDPLSAQPVEVVFIEFQNPDAARAAFRGGSTGFGGGQGPSRGGGPVGGRGGGSMGGSSHGASARLIAWEKDPSFAWHTTLTSDEVSWGRWRADYRVERSFLEGGSWRDSARVNLSQKGRSLVLFARWPDEIEVPLPVLRELLRSVEMLELEET